MTRFLLLSNIPMFGFTVIAFVLVCTILAIATLLVFKSGDTGTTKLGGCAGCAIGFALLAIAGLATAVTAGVMLLTTRAEIVRHGPVKRLEIDLDDDGGESTTPAPRSGASDRGSAAKEKQKSLHPVTPPKAGSVAPGTPAPSTAKDDEHAVHLRLLVRGREYPTEIADWIRDHTEGDVSVTITPRGDETLVDVSLPIKRAELDELRRDLAHSLPGMKLPKGVRVEIKDTDD
jgi:hypothetical protein